jgi:hypothetical protein
VAVGRHLRVGVEVVEETEAARERAGVGSAVVLEEGQRRVAVAAGQVA